MRPSEIPLNIRFHTVVEPSDSACCNGGTSIAQGELRICFEACTFYGGGNNSFTYRSGRNGKQGEWKRLRQYFHLLRRVERCDGSDQDIIEAR